MKTKPFNLDAALSGAKVVTRNGYSVYIKRETIMQDSAGRRSFNTEMHKANTFYCFSYDESGLWGYNINLNQKSIWDLLLVDESDSEGIQVETKVEDNRIGINDKINPELMSKRLRDWA